MLFTLTGDEGDFTIDNDGVLSIARSLDRETTEEYNIIVRVFDRGQPQMSAETALTITVEDVNDQAPVFEQVRGGIRGRYVIAKNFVVFS